MKINKKYKIIDPKDLPKRYEFKDKEKFWRDIWEDKGIYKRLKGKSRSESFVIDSPPPTVSGSLHVGHIFSYTHQDIIARYKRMQNFNVIGGGAWGTALAQMLAATGRLTKIWAREAEVVTAINGSHSNDVYLPNVLLNRNLKATSDLAEAATTDVMLLVTPAQFLRPVVKELTEHLKPGLPHVLAVFLCFGRRLGNT